MPYFTEDPAPFEAVEIREGNEAEVAALTGSAPVRLSDGRWVVEAAGGPVLAEEGWWVGRRAEGVRVSSARTASSWRSAAGLS